MGQAFIINIKSPCGYLGGGWWDRKSQTTNGAQSPGTYIHIRPERALKKVLDTQKRIQMWLPSLVSFMPATVQRHISPFSCLYA